MHITADSPVILMMPLEDKIFAIIYIYTPPELRGQGLMAKMFEKKMKWADDNNIRMPLCLNPDPDTDFDRLRAFYARHSFEFIGADGLRLPESER